MHPQLTVEILLPELREPNVPPVVGQRAAPEIPIERCRGGGGNSDTSNSDNMSDVHVVTDLSRKGASERLPDQRGDRGDPDRLCDATNADRSCLR